VDDPLTAEDRLLLHLDALGIEYATLQSDDDEMLVVRLGDDAAAFVYVDALASGHSALVIQAPILEETEPDVKDIAPLLAWSREFAVGKIIHSAEGQYLAVQHELLGDFLDQEEVSAVLYTLGRAVSVWTPRIRQQINGDGPLAFSAYVSADGD
jgi:hypothetical protein